MRIRLKPLADQVIVITGATSGIGRATAIRAAAAGARVVLAARDARALDTLAAELGAVGGRAWPCPTDVSDPEAVARLAAHAVATCGRIDTWVNNAGVAIAARLADLPLAEARRLFDVNFWGVVHGSHAALPHLRRAGGALINLGSFTSDVAAPFMGMYSASKQAIRGYTDALRIELRIDRAPVSVTLIKPGPIATPVLEHQRNHLGPATTMPPPFYMPDDVARTILYAACHPVRDLHVGSIARVGSIVGPALPGLTDALAARFGPALFRVGGIAEEAPGNLLEPAAPARLRGDTRGRTPHPSLYTLARLHRWQVGAAAAAVAMLVATRRAGRHSS